MAKRGPDIASLSKEKPVKKRINHLLVIAIDDYKNYPRLYNCRRDAERFIEVLTNKYQFEEENVSTLYNEDATEENILDVFRQLVNTIDPDDNIVVIYSGHGAYENDINEGYWIPVDAEPDSTSSFIANSYIVKYLKAIKAHHILLIVDSCFSGSLFSTREVEINTASQRLDNIASRWLLTAGRMEVVSDGKPGDNSPFTDNVLYFLENNDTPSLSISKLAQQVTEAVVYNTKQTPRGEPLQDMGHRGGQFHFHQKGAKASLVNEKNHSSQVDIASEKPVTSPLKKYWKIGVIATLLLFATAIAFMNTSTPISNEPQMPSLMALQYDSFYDAGIDLLIRAADKPSLEEAKSNFQQAIKIAQRTTGIEPAKAKTALIECELKLKELEKRTNIQPHTIPTDSPKQEPTQQKSPSKEEMTWNKAVQINTETAYRKYISSYPKSKYIEQAKNRISELYDYKLNFTTNYTTGDKLLVITVNKGKPPFETLIEYQDYQITHKSNQGRFSISLKEIKASDTHRIGSVIVRDYNYKAKGSKILF